MTQRNPEPRRLYWSREEIAAWQLQSLRRTIERARRTQFYASRLESLEIQSLNDLSRLPLTHKEDLRNASPDGLIAVSEDELVEYHESFGTTGTPVSSWMSRGDLDNYATQINHTAVDFHCQDRVLVRFPYAISVPAHIVTHAVRRRGGCVIPVSSRTNVSPHSRVIQLLHKLQATVMGCLPTEAVLLAETASLGGFDPAKDFPHLRAICTAGELLSDARRARIASLWNCDVYNMYGCTEAGNIAAHCDAGRLHLSWDHFLYEVLDPQTHEPVPWGEMGVGVLTTLTREASPLLRFVLGDHVSLLEDHECPCGRTAPVLEHFGRDLNRFEFGGRTFLVRDLEERLFEAPVAAIGDLWLIELSKAEVRFRVETERPDPKLYSRLEEQVQQQLELPLKIDAVPPGKLLDRSRLRQVAPVGKPRVVGQALDEKPGTLTLDDLMPG